MIIELNGIDIEITKKPIKNINLRIYPPHGLVKLSAPLHFKDQLIRDFLLQKSSWITKHQQLIRSKAKAKYEEGEQVLVTGSRVLYQGSTYLLTIKEQPNTFSCNFDGTSLNCTLPSHPTQKQLVQLIDGWYRAEMETILPALLEQWEAIIKVKASSWCIKKMKSRWGSCNTRTKRICLNLNLMKNPPECLEYVLVHELVHLLEPSHNARFYQLMGRFMPLWQEYRTILEKK